MVLEHGQHRGEVLVRTVLPRTVQWGPLNQLNCPPETLLVCELELLTSQTRVLTAARKNRRSEQRAGPEPCQNRGFSVCVAVPALIIIRTWSESPLTRCFHEGGGRPGGWRNLRRSVFFPPPPPTATTYFFPVFPSVSVCFLFLGGWGGLCLFSFNTN